MDLSQVAPQIPKGYAVWVIYASSGEGTSVPRALAYTSIVLSSVIIIIFIITQLRHTRLREHISFRLSLSIAVADLMYAIIQACCENEAILRSMSSRALRVLLLLNTLSLGAFAYINTCIAFHLHMTMILNRPKIATIVSPYYELISWVVAFIFAQPLLYIGETLILPDPTLIMLMETSWKKMRLEITLVYLGTLICVPYCFVICVMILIRMLPIWRLVYSDPLQSSDKNSSSSSKSGSNLLRTSGATHNSSLCNIPGGTASLSPYSDPKLAKLEAQRESIIRPTEQQRSRYWSKRWRINFAIFRIVLYPLMPVFCTLLTYVYFVSRNPSISLGYHAVILPMVAAILNFGLFLTNPTLDDVWYKWWKSLQKSPSRRKSSSYTTTNWIRLPTFKSNKLTSPSQTVIRDDDDHQFEMSWYKAVHTNNNNRNNNVYLPAHDGYEGRQPSRLQV